MKIKINEKPFLEDGRHMVTITEVNEGTSENKGVPFFSCRFENDEGFVNQRFYQSEPSMPILASLLRAVGMEVKEGKTIDTQKLVGKQLSVEVGERTYADPESGKEKTIKEATHFKQAGEAETSAATEK